MQNSPSFRTVQTSFDAPRHRHGAGLVTTDVTEADLGPAIDPFIVVSLYDMAGPTFPPHPHAGFSVATYILPESPIGFINHDTLGKRNRIAPGALHVTVAGSGVQHEEQPETTGSLARGFQIWIDHADDARLITPHALHLRPDAVPIVERDGAQIRTVLGSSNGAASPLDLPTPVRVIDVTLEPGGRFVQDLAPGDNAFVMMLEGQADIMGARLNAGAVATMSVGESVLSVSAFDGPARFTLFAGRPLRHQRVQRGPFVASNAAQLQSFVTAFETTRFGALVPFAAQPDWQPNDGQILAR